MTTFFIHLTKFDLESDFGTQNKILFSRIFDKNNIFNENLS